jgi:hypothetical protein
MTVQQARKLVFDLYASTECYDSGCVEIDFVFDRHVLIRHRYHAGCPAYHVLVHEGTIKHGLVFEPRLEGVLVYYGRFTAGRMKEIRLYCVADRVSEISNPFTDVGEHR